MNNFFGSFDNLSHSPQPVTKTKANIRRGEGSDSAGSRRPPTYEFKAVLDPVFLILTISRVRCGNSPSFQECSKGNQLPNHGRSGHNYANSDHRLVLIS